MKDDEFLLGEWGRLEKGLGSGECRLDLGRSDQGREGGERVRQEEDEVGGSGRWKRDRCRDDDAKEEVGSDSRFGLER